MSAKRIGQCADSRGCLDRALSLWLLQADARDTVAASAAVPAPALTQSRVNVLAHHIEAVIFGAGHGDLKRTQLLLAAVLDRPTVQRVLGSGL